MTPFPQSWRLISPTPSPIKPTGPDAAELMTYNEYLEGIMKPDKASKKAAKAAFTKPGGVSRYMVGRGKSIYRASCVSQARYPRKLNLTVVVGRQGSSWGDTLRRCGTH